MDGSHPSVDVLGQPVHFLAALRDLLQWHSCSLGRSLCHLVSVLIADGPERMFLELLGGLLVQVRVALDHPDTARSVYGSCLDALPPAPVWAWCGAELFPFYPTICDQRTISDDRRVALREG